MTQHLLVIRDLGTCQETLPPVPLEENLLYGYLILSGAIFADSGKIPLVTTIYEWRNGTTTLLDLRVVLDQRLPWSVSKPEITHSGINWKKGLIRYNFNSQTQVKVGEKAASLFRPFKPGTEMPHFGSIMSLYLFHEGGVDTLTLFEPPVIHQMFIPTGFTGKTNILEA